MSLNNVGHIKQKIYWLLAQQKELVRRSGKRNKVSLSLFNDFDAHICKLEDELWWLNFIEYCNTDCWRFKC